MPKISPIHHKRLVKFFEERGFALNRQKGDHFLYVKEGMKRPVVIPASTQVPVFVILNNLQTAKISRDEYLKFLKQK